MYAEHVRDGRAGDVRVKDGGLVPAAAHQHCKQGGDKGFPYAAFAAYDGDDFFDA